MTDGRIRVLIADDHALLREGLRHILSMEDDIEVIGEACNGDEVLELSASLLPDIVIMDINMPNTNGLEATKRLKSSIPSTEIVALTIHSDEEYVLGILKSGAKGYVLKDDDPSNLIQAIRRVVSGGSYVPPDLLTGVLEEFRRYSPGEQPEPATLSPREMEVLRLIVEGRSNAEIASELYISEKTVKNHVTNILRKCSLNDRTQAAVYALRNHLVE